MKSAIVKTMDYISKLVLTKNNIMLFTIFLIFSGSNIQIFSKIRLFHFGILLAGFLLTLSLSSENKYKIFLSKRPALVVSALAIYFAVPLFWIMDISRFITFWCYIVFGLVVVMFGRLCKQKMKHLSPVFSFLLMTFWATTIAITVINAKSLSGYPPEGGAFGNVNDMAIALICLTLFQYTIEGKCNYWLVSASLAYTIYLDRRLCLIALIIFCLLDIISNLKMNKIFYKKISIYAVILGTCYIFHQGHSRGFKTERFEPPTSATAATTYNSGDYIRYNLLQQLVTTLKNQPLLQTVFGKGPGQLNVKMLTQFGPGTIWSSPHFFLLEMFFYFGILWLLLLLYIFFSTDAVGKIALTVVFGAGVAASSMIYFMPFYLVFGAISARKKL